MSPELRVFGVLVRYCVPEVRFGILSLGYGIGCPMILVAALSLALNLVLTGAFIAIVKKLLAGSDLGARAAREGSA